MGYWTFLKSDSGLDFEAKNHLPHLWMAMLDADAFEAAVPKLRAAWDAWDIEGDKPIQDPGIVVPLESALATYRRRAESIVRTYPEVERLHADFGRHVEAHGEPEVRINALSLALMSDVDWHITWIRRTVEEFDAGGVSDARSCDLLNPYEWVGVETYRDGPFTKTSAAYLEAKEAIDRRQRERQKMLQAQQPGAAHRRTPTLHVRLKEAMKRLRR